MTRTARWTLGLGVLGAFVWSAWATEVSASRVVEGLPFMLDFIRRMVPPDLSVMGHALHSFGNPERIPRFKRAQLPLKAPSHGVVNLKKLIRDFGHAPRGIRHAE